MHRYLFLLIFTISSIMPMDEGSALSRVEHFEDCAREMACGAVRGAYESLVYTSVLTAPTGHFLGTGPAQVAAGMGVFLPMPHIMRVCRLQSLHDDLIRFPQQQDWNSFDLRVHAEDAVVLPKRMYEVGHIAGSLVTSGVVLLAMYKYLDKIPEDDRKKLLIASLGLGAFAWITKDFGRNLRE